MKKRTSTGLVGRISRHMAVLCGGVAGDVIKTTLGASMQSIRSLNKKKRGSWEVGSMKLNMMKMVVLKRKSLGKRQITSDAM